MKYIGEFKSIDNTTYRVEIITNHNTISTKDIVLSGNPFTTDMDTSDENIYKPVKYSGATVGIVTRDESDYMFDVYSGEANGTNVTLYKGNDVLWAGFVTPVIYNNGYTSVHEELEIEAIDGLSILQYIKYSANQKEIKSFFDILCELLQKCEVYTKFYFSNSLRTDYGTTGDIDILDKLCISEQNFFKQKNDTETDNDVAWTCKDVLEEICQYLNVVCVGKGDKVWFLDLDGMTNGEYIEVDIYNKTKTLITNQTRNVAIDGTMYRGNDANISLDNVYNKVSVKDDFYTFEDVIPDIYDTSFNITKDSDPVLASSTNINNGMYGEVVPGDEGNAKGDINKNMICMVDRVYDPEEEEYTCLNAVFVKYFNHPNYIFHSYKGSDSSSLNYTDTKSFYGSCIAKFCVKEIQNKFYSDWWSSINTIAQNHTLDEWLAKNDISNITFNNYIMMLNPYDHHISNGDVLNYPYFETDTIESTAMFGGSNAYILLQGSYIFHYVSEDPYPIPENEVDISEGRYAMEQRDTHLVASLQWGDKWWNGSDWVTSDTTVSFNIPYCSDVSTGGDRRADNTMFKGLGFINTVSWRIGITEKGYLIELPHNEVMRGMPKLTIYKPIDPDYYSTKSGDDEGQWYKHTVVFLKDFHMKAVIGDPTYSDVNDTDTIYTNIINEDNVQDLGEITFKICTNDNKSPNFSSVGIDNNGTFNFLEKIYNVNMLDNDVIDYDGVLSDGSLRPEEWLIYRLTKQYTYARIRLELPLKLYNSNDNYEPYTTFTDKWLVGKKFIIDSISTDYYNDVQTVTLIEKA